MGRLAGGRIGGDVVPTLQQPSTRRPSGRALSRAACGVLAGMAMAAMHRSTAPAAPAAPAALFAGAAHAAAPAPADEGRTADVAYVLDDFEADDWPDPALWPAVTHWQPSPCQAISGRRSLRAFPAPDGAPGQGCDDAPPSGATAAAALRLDLRAAGAANRLELQFDALIKLNAGTDAGLVVWLEVPRPDGAALRVPVFGATGNAGGWAYPTRHLDLRNLVDVRNPAVVYDLRGGLWTLSFTAAAPTGGPAGGGVYIDRLALIWEPDQSFPTPTAPPPPSPTPTRPTPTAVRTTPPTEEPTPTDAPPTPTRPRPAGLAYLPVLRRDPSPTPTPTPTETETPTATPSPAPTAAESATPTDGPPPSPTATDAATATPIASPTPEGGPVAAGTAGRRSPAVRRRQSAYAPMLSSPPHAPVAQRIERLASNQ